MVELGRGLGLMNLMTTDMIHEGGDTEVVAENTMIGPRMARGSVTGARVEVPNATTRLPNVLASVHLRPVDNLGLCLRLHLMLLLLHHLAAQMIVLLALPP